MSLPTPNLDDRTWKDIVEDAKKLIPVYCPNWTDFNPSDPGITLLELMAWMSEMILYRLNRVPEKNYIKFMELMGIKLTPPKSASTLLTFLVAENADSEKLPYIPPNTRVHGVNSENETVVFETVEPLNLTASRLEKVFTQYKERYSDRTVDLLDKKEITNDRFDVFKGKSEIPHVFYIGDQVLAKTGHDFYLKLHFDLLETGSQLHVNWSCWNGEDWQTILPLADETVNFSKSGAVTFTELPPMKTREIYGCSSYWIRFQLDKYRKEAVPTVISLKKCLELKQVKGILPDNGFISTEEIPFMPLLFQGIIYPFGREAKMNDTLYIASDVFSKKDAPVSIDIKLVDSYNPPEPDDLAELQVYWEYHDQTGNWNLLGITTPAGVTDSLWGFSDETEAFTHSGKVFFIVPDDIASLDLIGQRLYWIRVRIHRGNYGIKKKKNPPVLNRFLIHYKEKPTYLEYYLSYNDFNHKVINPAQPFQPFVPVSQKAPELYFGFSAPFTNKTHRIAFRLSRRGNEPSEVVWEYPGPDGWKKLSLLNDTTEHFTSRGVVEFVGPPDWKISQKFGHWVFWMRVRWTKYNIDRPPHLRSVHLNVANAINAVSTKNEILGSSNGEPFQAFHFKASPLLPGSVIIVRELDSPQEEQVRRFREQVKEETLLEMDSSTGELKALWVVWNQVDNFYYSERESRHYMLDIYNGRVTFGDGIRGKIPPIGSNNVRCKIYYTGGGLKGNVGRNVLTGLDTAFPYVQGVTNPYTAEGGSDMESLEEAKLRTPWELKHNRRTVTKEDFEVLAMEATDEIARAFCISAQEGIVKLIIIPKTTYDGNTKLIPSATLCDIVNEFLSRHRLITTKIQISGPGYSEFTIQTEVVLKKNLSVSEDDIKSRIETIVKNFFHPLNGGLTKNGWPMGRNVHISEIYYLIENVDGVDYIDDVRFNSSPTKDKIEVSETAFPYLKEITITFSGG